MSGEGWSGTQHPPQPAARIPCKVAFPAPDRHCMPPLLLFGAGRAPSPGPLGSTHPLSGHREARPVARAPLLSPPP